MITSYQVVDDFSEQHEAVRASAFASGFGKWAPNQGKVGSSKYDGMCFYGHHAPMLHALSRAVGGVVYPNTVFFRITNKDTEKAYIHSDRTAGNHTCIVYLSRHDSPTGTAFWRHKPTGLAYMPTFEEQKERGIEEELKADMVTGDPDKWEMLDLVAAQYNRALIFQAPLFHSRFPLDGFGEGDGEKGRLVWVTHFYRLNAQGGLY